MNVVVNGLMTHYERSGKGRAVVLLPGWGQNLESFNDLAKNLKPKYSVLAVDLPGFGGTEGPSEAWGLDEYAAFVAAWLEKIDIKGVLAYIGHSHGGAVSIKGLSQGTLKADKLILLASAGVRDKNKTKRLVFKSLSRTGKIITAPLPAPAKKTIRRKFYSKLGSDIGLLPHMEDTFRKVISQDIQPDARRLKLPVLLIYGSRDQQTPLSFGRLFHHEIEESQLKVVEGAGHFVHHEQPARVNGLIKNFLEGSS
jgi:pimeloyl-ACP methyl ester carboxylesterase